ncbi:MAG: UDP-glucose/GDP-mannose dehydrogenase family protein [Chloroflexi bacterium]|nr:UDP-glucose/GDP-mannose dehydrogenase family protein [Chloroflexota bacterium]
MSNICVIGTGYVGLVTGTCFADLGNTVVCVDIDAERIKGLNQDRLPIFEPGLEEMVARNRRKGRLKFTTSYDEGVENAEFVFLAVGTPSDSDGSADMRQVEAAAQGVGKCLRQDAVIINKSTVPIGTGDQVARILREHAPSGLRFEVVSNPEFLREGSAVLDFMEPDRIIIGSDDGESARRVAELYHALGARIMITSLRTAEMIKYASNAILASRISFINEIAQTCEKLGADVKVVAEGMGLDKRIGNLFLNAGIGFGGSCFPKDVKALKRMAEQVGCDPKLLTAVMHINAEQRLLFVEKVERAIGGLRSKSLGVWGLSFKPNTDDLRDAPSIDIISLLLERGASVKAYDPAAMERFSEIVPSAVLCKNAYEAASGCDALLLLTEWNEFKQVDLAAVKHSMARPVFLDGRNLSDPEEMVRLGFEYWGVGRACPAKPLDGDSKTSSVVSTSSK